MTNSYIYEVDLSALVHSSAFSEATRDELKVLFAILSANRKPISDETVAKIAGASLARVKATIALFLECGVLTKSTSDTLLAEVEYEFEPTAKNETTAKEIAKSIRDDDLYEMQAECENLLGKTLSTYEISNLTKLHTEKGLSTQYILTLSAYVTDVRKRPTVAAICRLADQLIKQEIDTLEELEKYIIDKNNEIKGEMEIRRIFGIRERSTAPIERKYFSRWMDDFGYSVPIITEAYDICIHYTGALNYNYIDATLEAWHTAGCKTLEECQAQAELHRIEAAKKASAKKKPTAKEATTPKYADFNSEEALMRALERSYGANTDD